MIRYACVSARIANRTSILIAFWRNSI